MSKNELEKDYIRTVCLFCRGKQQCRYLRIYKGRWICGKNTAAGIKHSKIVEEALAEGAGEEQIKLADGKKVTFIVPLGDNCPGRSDEFAHLFGKKAN